MDSGTATLLVLIGIFFLFYLLPSVIAFRRRHPNRWVILVINVAGGVTGLAWLLTLVWACQAVHKSQNGNGGESGLNVFAHDPQLVRLQSSPSEELMRLQQLLKSGAITRVEFARLKAEVMAERG